MRTSIMIGEVRGPVTAAGLREQAAAAHGLDGIWAAQALGWDALTALTVAGTQQAGIPLGTAVVPVRQRHPLVLASQALSVQAATGGRLTLGIGVGIGAMVTAMFGLPAAHPARYLREYLSALLPLLRGEPVTVSGDFLTLSGTVDLPTDPPEVLVAALSPVLLHLAGSLTAGTVTWMAGPRTLESHVVPRVTAAAGTRTPRIVAALPVCVTTDPAAARDHVATRFGLAARVPEYRAVLDRENAAGPEDVAVIGDEHTVRTALRRLAETGITEFVAAPVGTPAEQHRTTELLRTA
ncbi:TIGR03564 family F420-dependent LLM class oxidoreductase [Actinoplanes sichuanensis]|uniref:TIGR03564 family F420-dependent LLM class oxidoreductase n=1 Tax=Actinoplanes sichuanensis TaxID=512349 RepID=A0ABW4AIW0_9ACTN|nr:TIGR03564 family F420-dependent LLM class oxidoreductase [Actinoplanes sichuanensis]BEL03892.1 TIGR03564 family F420-dependent LLM class oxidoreductase [Actinoplanes sichuanensis]